MTVRPSMSRPDLFQEPPGLLLAHGADKVPGGIGDQLAHRAGVRLGPLAVELAELAGGDGLQQSGGEQALIAVGLPGKDPRLTGGEAAGVLGGLGAQRRNLGVHRVNGGLDGGRPLPRR